MKFCLYSTWEVPIQLITVRAVGVAAVHLCRCSSLSPQYFWYLCDILKVCMKKKMLCVMYEIKPQCHIKNDLKYTMLKYTVQCCVTCSAQKRADDYKNCQHDGLHSTTLIGRLWSKVWGGKSGEKTGRQDMTLCSLSCIHLTGVNIPSILSTVKARIHWGELSHQRLMNSQINEWSELWTAKLLKWQIQYWEVTCIIINCLIKVDTEMLSFDHEGRRTSFEVNLSSIIHEHVLRNTGIYTFLTLTVYDASDVMFWHNQVQCKS